MTAKLLRPDQVAIVLSISKRQVYTLVREGKLQGHSEHPGCRGLRIFSESLEEYLQKFKIDPDTLYE